MKVVETVRKTDQLAPFSNEEFEHRAEWAAAKDEFVELLQKLEKVKNKRGELTYPSGKIALSDPAITAWKKKHDIKVSLGVFVKTFRDIMQLSESNVFLRKEAKPVLQMQKAPKSVDELSEKQKAMRQALQPKVKELVQLIENETEFFSIRVSDPRVKEWFTGVAAYIKNVLKDRQSGITKLSNVLELYPDKFALKENRTLISLVL
jgi:hypothetical protein